LSGGLPKVFIWSTTVQLLEISGIAEELVSDVIPPPTGSLLGKTDHVEGIPVIPKVWERTPAFQGLKDQ
jgi:hypothetical protein